MREDIAVWFVGAAVIGVLCFLSADCAMGTKGTVDAIVQDKEYRPPWTETRVSCDEKGWCQTDHIHHPAHYGLIVQVPENEIHTSVTARQYHRTNVGEPVFVDYRAGKWTKAWWVTRVRPYPESW